MLFGVKELVLTDMRLWKSLVELFTSLAISIFENIEKIEFPCDEFYECWEEGRRPKDDKKYEANIKLNISFIKKI